jgi:hypothetical protein
MNGNGMPKAIMEHFAKNFSQNQNLQGTTTALKATSLGNQQRRL